MARRKTLEEVVKARFLRDVSQHQMEVVKDDGLFRHLRFNKGGSSVYHFNLTTWPGYLCVSGDMGCFVFNRLQDMFVFFRYDHLTINPRYWAQKVEAGKAKEWSQEHFERNVKEHVLACFSDSFRQCRKAMRSVREHIFDHCDGEWESTEAISTWDDPDDTGLRFDDFWEYDNEEYTHSFLWCCYAIVWGIQQYDAHKEASLAKAV